MEDLNDIRNKIDAIDERLVKTLNKRAALGKKIAQVKRREGKPVYYPAREEEILARVAKLNDGPLSNSSVQAIFSEIFSGTRSVEKELKIACLGPAGTFTHLAALASFGSQAKFILEKDFDAIFSQVERGLADYGVVPVENSSEGAIGRTLDLLLQSDICIYGERYLTISHNILSNQKSLDNVSTLYTHYMPLAQSRVWVVRNLPNVTVIETSSSTEAVARAAKDKNAAAIGSGEAAKIYGLPILATGIEDESGNQTRFLIISRTRSPRSGNDKTSLVLLVKDSPGALQKIIRPFSSSGINLSRIESRPLKSSEWEYAFYVDIDGHEEDEAVSKALSKVHAATTRMKILGSYPNGRK